MSMGRGEGQGFLVATMAAGPSSPRRRVFPDTLQAAPCAGKCMELE